MEKNLSTSITSLISWSDKILTDSARRHERLDNFLQEFNMRDYQKSYFELLPFVQSLVRENPDMFQKLVFTYKENGNALNEAMKLNFWDRYGSILPDLPIMVRKADDLIDAIRQIKSNAENIEYSLKLDN